MNIREEIKKHIQDAFKDGVEFAEGYDKKVKGTADGHVNDILSLVQQEIMKAIPEEQQIARCTCPANKVCDCGFKTYNQVILEIKNNLRRSGLLPEEKIHDKQS